jgi:thioredoxin-like negative regulator of GroEL
LAAENEGAVKFGKLNIDESPKTTSAYSINSVPTLIIFKNGEQVQRFLGIQPKGRLQDALDAAK